MSAEPAADVAVVGLGGLGSAAACWAARMGARVVGLEQFPLGHDRGGSHDHSRLIRLAYHHPDYVRLAATAYDVWDEVERAAGEQLVHLTGGIDMFGPDAPLGRDVYAAGDDRGRRRGGAADRCGRVGPLAAAGAARRRACAGPRASRVRRQRARHRRPPAAGPGGRRGAAGRVCRHRRATLRPRPAGGGGRAHDPLPVGDPLGRSVAERAAGAAGREPAAHGQPGADLLPGGRRSRSLPSRPVPGLDLARRPHLLRVPGLR